MKKYAIMALGALAGLALSLPAMASAPDDGEISAFSITETSANQLPTSQPLIMLAQGEGDIDESFDSHGADTDEQMEEDNALAPRDTTKKTPTTGTPTPKTATPTSGSPTPATPATPKPAEPKATTPAPGTTPGTTPGTADVAPSAPRTDVESLTKGIRWLGHASFLIQDAKNIYVDPYDLPGGLPPADLILVTHDHGDHFSPDDIAKIIKESTTIVSIDAVRDKIPKKATFRAVKPGDTLTVQGVRIEVVPAYNIGKQFHPKEKGYVGFIIHSGGRSIYHAGDTDLIPEMKNIKTDVALLPAGGKFTMDGSEAAKAANLIKPKVAIPMHWGKIIGSDADAQTFKAQAQVPVVILKPEPKQAEAGKKPK